MIESNPTVETGGHAVRIGPEDPRYVAVVNKRFNKRFSSKPYYVRVVG